MIAETHWSSGDGVGYYLRDDGTVRAKMEFRGGVAQGRAICYKDDGVTVDHVAEFRDGHKVETDK